ncbi:MAG: 6-bladed beta-propeller [Bacteroidales bacterium]
MRTNSAIFFLCFLLTFSCRNEKNITAESSELIPPYPLTINVNEGLKNKTTLRLSEVADSIRYVILSEERDVAVNFVFEVALTDSAIITSVSQCPFLIFDLNGKFIDTIGRIGRGPHEYMPGSKFSVDPASGDIIVNRNFLHDFISFDLNGGFIDNDIPELSGSIESFVCLPGSRLALFPAYDGRELLDDNIRKSMILMGLFDKDGNKLSGISHPAQNIPSDFVASRFITGSPVNRNTYFKNEIVTPCYENSVYKINSDSIYTGFKINWDKLAIPETFEEKYYLRSSSARYPFAEIRGKFIETPGNAFFILANDGTNYLMEYDKLSGLASSMSFAEDDKAGFINDLDGGHRFFPFWTNREGDIWIDFVEAPDLKTQYTDDFLKDNDAVNPGSREKLIDFIKKLQSDDNPVLRMVYLKKPF